MQDIQRTAEYVYAARTWCIMCMCMHVLTYVCMCVLTSFPSVKIPGSQRNDRTSRRVWMSCETPKVGGGKHAASVTVQSSNTPQLGE